MKPPVRHFALMVIGLSTLLAMLAIPVHAEVYSGEKSHSPVQSARLSDAKQHAIHANATDHAAFQEKRTAGTACERGEAKATLSVMQAKAASIDHQVNALSQRWRETKRRSKSYTEAIQPLLLLIQHLSLYPAETRLAVPASPDATLHDILILQSLAQQMGSRVDALQLDRADLNASLMAAKAARKAADARDHNIAATQETCAAAKAEANVASRHAAVATTQSNNPPVGPAALRAEQHAKVKLREKARNAPRQRPIKQAEAAPAREAALTSHAGLCTIATGTVSRVRLQPPVHGVIVKDWGEATDAGPATGVSYQVASGARVVSPCGGRVVFANSFRSYRQLLIVDCGGGYHIVLSGLEKLEVQSGQTIGTGEPVGVMPSEPGPTAHRQVLYVELRHNGHPVNPALWLGNSG